MIGAGEDGQKLGGLRYTSLKARYSKGAETERRREPELYLGDTVYRPLIGTRPIIITAIVFESSSSSLNKRIKYISTTSISSYRQYFLYI